MTEKKGIDLHKLLKAGSLLAEARARGSSGGIASAIHQAGIDLSGKDDGGTSKPKKNTTNISPTTEQNTEDAAGKRFGGQGNKRRNQDPYIDNV